MARGLPDNPPEALQDQFVDAAPDDLCPACGWDAEPVLLDPPKLHAEGVLLAIEIAEGPVFSAMGGAQALAYYCVCPHCKTHFTVEVEDQYGGMT